MKYIPFYLNIIAFCCAIAWLIKGGLGFSPVITTLGLLTTMVTWGITTFGLTNVKGKKKPSQLSSFMSSVQVLAIYFILIVLLSLVVIFNFNRTTIIGIDGNHNKGNNIQIK